MKTTIAAPPPAPSPVDPGQSSIDYINAMADPALQQRLLDAERQFRPQYNDLNLADMGQYLLGTADRTGALSLFGQASDEAARIQARANTIQRQADIGDVANLGRQASDAFRAANPELAGALASARALQSGGYTTQSTQGGPDYAAYVRNNPDLWANWQNNTSKNTNKTLEQYGQEHYEQFGRNEGRQISLTGGASGQPVSGPGSSYQAFTNAVLAGQPNFGQLQFSPVQAALLGSAPQATSQGYAGAMLGSAPQAGSQGYQGSLLGSAPQAAAQGYNAALAAPVGNISADQIAAQNVNGGLLGGSLYAQALGASGLGTVGGALEQRAQNLAQSTGGLTPDEIRSLQQATREAYAARGTDMSSASVSAEALSRLTNERQRMVEDLGLAAAINAQNQAELGANRGFQQSVQGQELGRQFQNQGNSLYAQAQNQGASLQAAGQNQQVAAQQAALNQAAQNQAGQFGAAAANQAALANQATAAQYGLSNQAAQNAAGQYGAEAANRAALANQGVAAQYGLANQLSANQAAQFGAGAANQASQFNTALLGQYGLANQAAQNQFGIYNSQQGLATQDANRNFAAQQYQQNLGNLAMLGQANIQQLGADRAYALQLAQMQAAIASDPFQAILGRQSGALQYGSGQQGLAAGLTQNMQGPQLFDPNAGINLALQNASNLGNYQAATYGAQAAAQGARAGGMMSALGSLGGGLFGAAGAAGGFGKLF